MRNKTKKRIFGNIRQKYYKFYLILTLICIVLIAPYVFNKLNKNVSVRYNATEEITVISTPRENNPVGKLYEITNYQPKVFTDEIKAQKLTTSSLKKFSDEKISITFSYPSHWHSQVMSNGKYLPFNQDYGNVFQSTVVLNSDTVCRDISDDCRFLGILYWEGYDEHFANTYKNGSCTKFNLNNINGCIYSFGEGDFYMEHFDFMDRNNSGRFSVGVSAKYSSPELRQQVLQMLSTVRFK